MSGLKVLDGLWLYGAVVKPRPRMVGVRAGATAAPQSPCGVCSTADLMIKVVTSVEFRLFASCLPIFI